MKKEPALALLAAGASRRLGAAAPADRCKATVDLAGASPLRRLLRAGTCWHAAPHSPPALVVSGRHHDEIASELRGCGNIDILRNRAWEDGRTGSVIGAARARAGRDLCLAPIDVPLVPAAVFEALRQAWEEAGAPPRGWLAPRISDSQRSDGSPVERYGHPLVIGRTLLEELSTSHDTYGFDMPLRQLRNAAEPVFSVAVSSERILDDLDTPSDLECLRSISAQFSET